MFSFQCNLGIILCLTHFIKQGKVSTFFSSHLSRYSVEPVQSGNDASLQVEKGGHFTPVLPALLGCKYQYSRWQTIYTSPTSASHLYILVQQMVANLHQSYQLFLFIIMNQNSRWWPHQSWICIHCDSWIDVLKNGTVGLCPYLTQSPIDQLIFTASCTCQCVQCYLCYFQTN